MTMDQLWHKMYLQSYTETRTSSGYPQRSYATYATIWAALRTLSGNQKLVAQQAGTVLSHEATMVYCASVAPQPDHRLVWGSRIFDIRDVRNVDELNREVRMLCTEVLTEGPVSSASPSTSPSDSGSSSPSASPS
jgi:SPP1 family predicted phage head-tail adaptor